MTNPAFDRITNQIIDSLEKGIIPWRKPWTGIEPQNYITKSRYNGINYFILANTEYKLPYFLTFNQCRMKGGSIKKGSKGIQVIYWQMLEKTKKEEEDKPEYIPMLKVFTVFNIEQTTLTTELTETLTNFEPLTEAENIVKNFKN